MKRPLSESPIQRETRTNYSVNRSKCETLLPIGVGRRLTGRAVSRCGRWSRGRLYDDRILWPILAFELRILRTGRRLVPSESAG